MLTNIKGAIFDMDGTLIDSLMLWDIIWEKIGYEFLNQKEFRPTPEDDKAVRTSTLKDAMYHIHNIYNIPQNGDELFDKVTMIGIFSLIVVIAGVFGFLYEFIFYYFNGGMKEF